MKLGSFLVGILVAFLTFAYVYAAIHEKPAIHAITLVLLVTVFLIGISIGEESK